jgi:phage shock protein PspC (stress-responsive transcriptional regulator)
MKKDINNKMIFGVCSGLANEFQIDPTIVRLGFAVAALMGFGIPIVVYIVLAMVMPSK